MRPAPRFPRARRRARAPPSHATPSAKRSAREVAASAPSAAAAAPAPLASAVAGGAGEFGEGFQSASPPLRAAATAACPRLALKIGCHSHGDSGGAGGGAGSSRTGDRARFSCPRLLDALRGPASSGDSAAAAAAGVRAAGGASGVPRAPPARSTLRRSSRTRRLSRAPEPGPPAPPPPPLLSGDRAGMGAGAGVPRACGLPGDAAGAAGDAGLTALSPATRARSAVMGALASSPITSNAVFSSSFASATSPPAPCAVAHIEKWTTYCSGSAHA